MAKQPKTLRLTISEVTCHPDGVPCSCSEAGYPVCNTTKNRDVDKLFRVTRNG